jgi:hypothetical protein
MRLALTLFIALHAAIHLLGFLKAWKLAALPALSGRTVVPLGEGARRAFGLAWLAAALVLLGTSALRVAHSEAWWMVALPGIVLSQALIAFQWADAKAGTLGNVVIALSVVVAAATSRFEAGVVKEVRDLIGAAAPIDSGVVRREALERLPPPVARWLTRSGVVGKPEARTIRLRQRGEMRTSPSGEWMPARARQYFSVNPPGFVWSVDVTMARVIPIVGRDRYVHGRGQMRITAAALLDVVDASGEMIDQGTLLRYLGEIVWFPSAALSAPIAWEPVDARHARATMSHAGVTASAVFGFDALDRFADLEARRYMGDGPRAKLERWSVSARSWRTLSGIEIPVRGVVRWHLDSGEFEYYRWEILDIDYDVATL